MPAIFLRLIGDEEEGEEEEEEAVSLQFKYEGVHEVVIPPNVPPSGVGRIVCIGGIFDDICLRSVRSGLRP